jgi:uncharacterized membrane protein
MVDCSMQMYSIFRRVSAHFPVILILIGIIGILITGVVIGRPDLMIRSLVLVIPFILAGALLFVKKGVRNGLEEISTYGRVRFHHLSMVYIVSLVTSIVSLYANNDRPLEYFLLIFLMSGLIFLQILKSDSRVKIAIVLTEILALSLCLIWGVTLNYPLYYGGTDTLQHLYLIGTIIDTGYINGLGDSYINFPLFHILIGISFQICGLPLQTTLFIVMGLIWQVGIIVAYLIFKKLTRSSSLALIACLLFALNAAVMQFGMYPVTRSFAFVFYLFMLLLLMPPHAKRLKIFLIQAIFLISLILTHHFTALLAVFIFTIIYIINNYVIRSSQDERVDGTFIMLYIVAFFSYLVYIAYIFTKTTISSKMLAILSEETTNVGEIASDPNYASAFIVNNSYAGIALFLSLLGIGYILMRAQRHSRGDLFIVLICLVSLVLYVPGAQYLLSIADDFLFYRVELLVAPFVVLGMAIGIKYLLNWDSGIDRRYGHFHGAIVLICVIIVVAATLSSTLANSNSVDSSDLNRSGGNSRYFSGSEVASLSFMPRNADHSMPLYSDYNVMRDKYHLGNFNSLNVLISGNTTYITEGYVILRADKLLATDTLMFSSNGRMNQDNPYYLSKQPDETNILYQLERECAIYDNGAVVIYLMNHGGNIH